MHNQDTYINFIDPKYRIRECLGACLDLKRSIVSHGLRLTLLLLRRHGLYMNAMMLEK